jgi:iron complex outermembrane receptor protein
MQQGHSARIDADGGARFNSVTIKSPFGDERGGSPVRAGLGAHMTRNPAVKRGRACPILLPVLLASSALSGVAPALAQTQSGQLETVVVTAEKRSENLQNVPISVQALSGETLNELHAVDFTTFARFLPSVSYTAGGQGSTGGPGFANPSMRGVNSGNDGNHSGSLPTVGVYLDEQPITTIGGTLDVPTFDVQRVEALSGPQGTLYGASSEAGTIRIITNQPDPSGFSAGYEVQGNAVDHGGLGYIVDGFVNHPINDDMAVRLVAWDEHDAGYIDNVHGTRFYPTSQVTIDNANRAKDNYNTVDKIGGRAALRIDLDANWTVTPSIIGQEERSNGVFTSDPLVGDLAVTHFFPEYAKDHWYQAGLTVQGKINNIDIVYSGGHMDRWIDTESDYTDYSFWYDTLYSYGLYWYDNAGNPINPSQYIIGHDKFTKDSHELRISTPANEPLRLVSGIFYERQTHWILQDYRINGLGEQISVPFWANTIWLTDQTRIDRDIAWYAEGSWDITKQLTLTGGVRVYGYDNSLQGFFGFGSGFSSHTGVSQCFSDKRFNGAPCTNLNKRVKDNGETHKLNLTYHIDDDRMVYFTYSTGFRPGGINRRGTIPPYDPDQLTNYELGWKTSWDDNHLRINGALYWEDWKNFQFSFLGANSFTEIHNGPNATIKGFEWDASWLPIDNLMLSTNGAFNDARTDGDFCGQVGITVCPGVQAQAPKGTVLPVTPKWKINAVGRYSFNLAGLDSYFQTALVYQTGSWDDLRVRAPNPVTGVVQPIRSFIGRSPGFATVDFSFGVAHDNWTAELALQNAFDERGQLYRVAECTTQICGNEPYILPTRPRMVLLDFSQHF